MSDSKTTSTALRRFRLIRGLRDLLPEETGLWNFVEQTARNVFEGYGFGEIRPPIFEAANLFEKSVGEDTDIVGKELYYWVDSPRANKGIRAVRVSAKETGSKASDPRSPVRAELLKQADGTAFDVLGEADLVALRPEATVSVCRAYVEHEMKSLPSPVKLYYMGPMFRRDRPQKGRYRQFYQIGVEVLEGVQPGRESSKDIPKDAAIDAEVIEMVMAFFERLGLQGVELNINSIGHDSDNCRRAYVAKLKLELEKVKEKLDEDSRRRIETNPLRVLDSKLESEQEIIAGLPRIGDHLCADCAKHYAELKRQLELRGVAYKENWRLVRGLDYYMRTTFEITAQGLGSQNAVCGGGRYDGLVELLGGAPTKGIGFAIGEDRVILSLQEAGKGSVVQGRDVYIAWMGKSAEATAIRAARELRAAGFRVELPPVEQKFGKALGQADKLGARYALILGEDEVASGEWTVKVLADGTQGKVRGEELVAYLKR